MRSGFNAPMGAANCEQAFGRCFGPGQTGNAEFDFAVGAITFALASPLKLALQPIDLGQAWPVGVGIQHFAGGDGADFNATMAFVHFVGRPKIGLDFSKAGFGVLGGKEFLNILVQPGLVLLDRKHKITLIIQNLPGGPFWGVNGVCGHHFL